MYDLMNYTQQNQIPGLLMLIDFEKAFDSISLNFIYQTLDLFNFGDSIKDWVKSFYSGIKSCVIQNGIASDYFTLNGSPESLDGILREQNYFADSSGLKKKFYKKTPKKHSLISINTKFVMGWG